MARGLLQPHCMPRAYLRPLSSDYAEDAPTRLGRSLATQATRVAPDPLAGWHEAERTSPRPPRRLPSLAAALLAGAGLGGALGLAATSRPSPPPPMPIVTPLELTVAVPATEEIALVSSHAGRLRWRVPPAAEVDSGALLAVVEASPPAETLAALRTAIHVARRARRVARLELTQAERAVERVVERSDRGRATWHELDEAEDKVAMARASLQLRDAELVEAKRALAAAARPRLHIVLAPQAGRLLLERAEENSLLSPGARLGTLKTGPRPQRGEER